MDRGGEAGPASILAFAYTVARSLYALGLAGYFREFFLEYVPGLSKTVVLVVTERGGRVVALAVVNVPRQLPIHEGLRFPYHPER